jgi:hypothetical protein
MAVHVEDTGFTLELCNKGGPTEEGIVGVVVAFNFIETDAKTRVIGGELLPAEFGFVSGKDRSRWVGDAPSFGSVKFVDLYEGINTRLYQTPEGLLEYDVILEPGAQLDKALIRVQGTNGQRIAEDGSLILKTAIGEIRQAAPKTWIEREGKKTPVAASYRLVEPGVFGFSVAEWDGKSKLVIDPVLEMSRFFGGDCADIIHSLQVADNGDIYVAGQTASITRFPLVTPYDSTCGCICMPFTIVYDGFLARLNSAGQVLYATYLGGSDNDSINDMALMDPVAVGVGGGDGSRYVLFGGVTNSTDLPTTVGALQTTFKGGARDGFAGKMLLKGGQVPSFLTYIGGLGDDGVVSVLAETDGAGPDSGILGGYSTSPNFPEEGAVVVPVGDPDYDGFVLRLDAAGASLNALRFFGGSENEVFHGVDYGMVDDRFMGLVERPNGRVTAVVYTNSADFDNPALAGFDSTYGGNGDAAVIRFSSDLSSTIWWNYLGGHQSDTPADMIDDGNGGVYICGKTASPDFPLVNEYWSGYLSLDETSGFVTRIRRNGNSILYSTKFGGEDYDSIRSIAPFNEDSVVVVGMTNTSPTANPPFPITLATALDPTGHAVPNLVNGFDGFMSILNTSMGDQGLVYSSYVAGEKYDLATHVTGPDMFGRVHLAGDTVSANTFNTTTGPPHRGSLDSFLMRISFP